MDIPGVFQSAGEVFDTVSGVLNSIVIALAIILLGFIVGRIIDRLLHKLFLRTEFDDRMFKVFGRRRRYALATRRTVVRIIYLATFLLALARVNLDTAAIYVVMIILVFIVLVSIVLAGVELFPHLIARRRLQKRRIHVGDTLEITDPSGTIKGKVIDISFIEVQVKRANGDILFIPLSAFLKNKIVKKRSPK